MAKETHPSSKTATGTTAKAEPRPVLTVAEARRRILERVRVLEPEPVPLSAAHGRVLAEDVRAERDVPPFPNSAMDGYAVRAADVRRAIRAEPVSLRVLGEIRAGAAPSTEVGPGGWIAPGLVGVRASGGRTTGRCFRQPRVALLPTGAELR